MNFMKTLLEDRCSMIYKKNLEHLRSCSILNRTPFIMAAAGMLLGSANVNAQADQPEDQSNYLETITVVAQRAYRTSKGATNLNMEISETPQSISVISADMMQKFGADSINEALRLTTGVRVEETSTNQTTFVVRGFDIRSTQVDGVGMPNEWGTLTNAVDSYGYERIEVIRGANGLLTGVGNASGTINYIRKRPTNEAQGHIGVSYGKWGNRRIEADYSTPFTDSGSWAGRVVVAKEKSDSHLRDFETDRTFIYGVVDGQIGENGVLAIGYSNQDSDTSGNMWGQLTFVANDGTQLEWDTDASTTQDWTYWNSNTENIFVDYTHQLGSNWQAKASYNYRQYAHDSQLMMGYSLTGLDPETGEGLLGWAYKSPYETEMHLFDLTVNGEFELFGHVQEVVFGGGIGKSERTDWYNPTDFSNPLFSGLPAFPYAGDAIPEPVWGDPLVYTTLDQDLKRFFAATRLTFTDSFVGVFGFNWAEYHRVGVNAEAVPFDQTESKISPYAGLTYHITDDIMVYASYSDIYQPQEETDINEVYLDPSKGVNYEIGVKAELLDGRLLTTLAWFSAKQQDLATYGGFQFLPDRAYAYYVGVDIKSKGWELEVVGELGDYTEIVFGATTLDMDGTSGSDTYPWVPRHTANLSLSTQIPSTPVSMGFNGRWQSKTSNIDSYSGYEIKQGSYAILDLFAAWDITPDLTLRANAGNVTNEKYINSLYYASYYGAPRSYSIGLDWRF
ncbi:TonB-dependent siderophore receptor [Kordiimonas pumila]|uniref:TonB-dependent siderophore receptor n=1 Tax=Kordiimonas pumila TaxID=2161677 RepID=A0ABV7D9A4_9PROT|nr:TonB-dependent siderophore receptor [Kordiimonas pumila]